MRLELTIDGTNFGGKTPLVALLVSKLGQLRSVECCNPFKAQPRDLYPLWAEAPVEAAGLVAALMRQHREASRAEVLIWDRGWPTVHMATRCAEARALVPPTAPTFVLLNTAATTATKVAKYGLTAATHPWMCGAHLPDETPYEVLVDEHSDCVAGVFRPGEDGVFDLEMVASAILATLLPAAGGA